MDHNEINEKQLILAASSCLRISGRPISYHYLFFHCHSSNIRYGFVGIAAKYVDVDMNVPRIQQLRALSVIKYSNSEYEDMELVIIVCLPF